jgi:DNA-binding MarR family transcriptional regulator
MSIELPRSAIIVLDRLTSEGPMTPKAISSRVDLAPRTVSFALRKLMGQKLCKKIPNLTDMRQPLYAADMERAKELRVKFEHVFRHKVVTPCSKSLCGSEHPSHFV